MIVDTAWSMPTVLHQVLHLWVWWKGWRHVLYYVFMTILTHLITVGVISAQKKMLSVLTAWEENMPMMEKATENFLFRLSRKTVQKTKKRWVYQKHPTKHKQLHKARDVHFVPVSWRRLYFPITGFRRRALKSRGEENMSLLSTEDSSIWAQNKQNI